MRNGVRSEWGAGRKALASDGYSEEQDSDPSEAPSHLGYDQDSDVSNSDEGSMTSIDPANSPILAAGATGGSPRSIGGGSDVKRKRRLFRRRRSSAPNLVPEKGKGSPGLDASGASASASSSAVGRPLPLPPPPLNGQAAGAAALVAAAAAMPPLLPEQEEQRRRRGLFGRRRSTSKNAQMKAASSFNHTVPTTTSTALVAAGNGATAPRPRSGGSTLRSFPPVQAMHRLRHDAKDGRALSSDPDYFPPVPLASEDSIGSASGEGAGHSGCVRYGDYLRMWATSSYVADKKSGYVGYIRRVNRRRHALGKGELFVVPPVAATPQVIFHDACFKVVDPRSEDGERDGEVLRYGEEFTLVDDRGMVWNNKDGRFHGRLGPSLFGNGGHMFMTLCRPAQTGAALAAVRSLMAPSPPRPPLANGAGTGNGSGLPNGTSNPVDLPGSGCASGAEEAAGEPVKYGDSCAIIAKKVRPRGGGDGGERAPVVRAAVTHSLRRHQAGVGGFLRSDGKGKPFQFIVHHAPPRVTAVAVYAVGADGRVVETHTHHKVPWNQEVEFDLPVVPLPLPLPIAHTAHPMAASPPGAAAAAAAAAAEASEGKLRGLGEREKESATRGLDLTARLTPPPVAGSEIGAAGGSPQARLRWADGDTSDVGGPPIVEIGLSTGGKLVLRRADLLRCRNRSWWFDAGDEQHPMCLKVRSRSLSSHEGEAPVGACCGRWPAAALSLTVAGAAAARIITARVGAWALRGSRHRFDWLFLEILWEAFVMGAVLLLTVRRHGALLAAKADAPSAAKGSAGGIAGSFVARRERCALKLIRCETCWAAERLAADGEEASDDDGEGGALGLPPVPETFLLAEKGDVDKATQRWRDTLAWRKENRSDEALATPHPHFDIVKRYYPTAFHGRDKEGSVVYYEQLGGINSEAMKALGVDARKLLWHYMYQMEYLWTVINPRIEDRTTIVLDMKGVGFGDVGGEVINFVKAAVIMLSTHYPERSNCIFIINAPAWFHLIIKLIKPILNEATQRKIRSCTANSYQKPLAEWIGEENIPREYGGKSPYSLFDHPWEVEMRAAVVRVLTQHETDMLPVPDA